MLREIDAAYIAGLLEGEGSFDLFMWKEGYNYPRIRLEMTDSDVVSLAANIMGVGRLHVRNLPSRKTLYSLNMIGPKAAAIMEQILPFMGTRRTLRIREILDKYYDIREKTPIKLEELV